MSQQAGNLLRRAARLFGRLDEFPMSETLRKDIDAWASAAVDSGLLVDEGPSLEAGYGRIIVRVDSRNEDAPAIGTVISSGLDVRDFRLGDRVMFGKYAGTEVRSDVFVLRTEEVLAMLRDGA